MLLSLLLYAAISANTLYSEIDTIVFEIGNPSSVHVLNDSTLIVVDPLHPEFVIYMMHSDGSIVSGIREGRGPGELNRNGFKDIVFLEDTIWIWDAGNQRAEIYDYTLEYVNSEVFELNRSMLHVFAPLNSSTQLISSVLSRNELLQLVDTDDKMPLYTLTNDSRPYLFRLSDNPLLKQFMISRSNEIAYLAFSSSSVILGINSSGETFSTQEPLLIDFPLTENPNDFTGPDFSKNKLVTLSIATCDEYVYTLQKGEKLDISFLSGLVSALRGKMIERVEAFEASNKLFVYRKNDLEFVREVTLPVNVRYLTVSGDMFVALKDTDEGRVLMRFPNELKE